MNNWRCWVSLERCAIVFWQKWRKMKRCLHFLSVQFYDMFINKCESSELSLRALFHSLFSLISRRWRISLASLLDKTSELASGIEPVLYSPRLSSLTTDFCSHLLDSISTINVQSSLTAFSRTQTPVDKHVRCFRTRHSAIRLANTGLIENSIDQEKCFYHGTSSEYASQILKYGIPSGNSFEPSDFGPGFYLNTSFEDARNWALRRTRNASFKIGIVLIFEIELANFNIWLPCREEAIDAAPSSSSSEWHQLIRLCRQCRCPHQLLYEFDGVRGPQCANPNGMRSHHEPPRVRYVDSQIAEQLCATSPALKSRLWSDFLRGVVILDQHIISWIVPDALYLIFASQQYFVRTPSSDLSALSHLWRLFSSVRALVLPMRITDTRCPVSSADSDLVHCTGPIQHVLMPVRVHWFVHCSSLFSLSDDDHGRAKNSSQSVSLAFDYFISCPSCYISTTEKYTSSFRMKQNRVHFVDSLSSLLSE